MKTRIISIYFVLFAAASSAQSTSDIPIQSISTDSSVVYRLFATKNIYIFIKLNTRNGQMWQVQWSTKSNQFQTTLSDISRIDKDQERNGRFFL